jgi:uncharacterized protein YndB with AHSA1/START domain
LPAACFSLYVNKLNRFNLICNFLFPIHFSPMYDWKRFTVRIPIKASPKSVYEAWTTQQGLESWFLRKALFQKSNGNARSKNESIEAGDQYTWLWHGYQDEVVEKHPVLAVNGWDHLQFEFSGNCIVTVTLKQDAGVVICELTQEMPMEDDSSRQFYFVECGRGWTFYLSNLKSVLEGVIDLRNRNVGAHPVIN